MVEVAYGALLFFVLLVTGGEVEWTPNWEDSTSMDCTSFIGGAVEMEGWKLSELDEVCASNSTGGGRLLPYTFEEEEEENEWSVISTSSSFIWERSMGLGGWRGEGGGEMECSSVERAMYFNSSLRKSKISFSLAIKCVFSRWNDWIQMSIKLLKVLWNVCNWEMNLLWFGVN